MSNSVQTTTALLADLLDPEKEDAWREFDARFRPILRAFCSKLAVSHADAEDVTQETLVRFLKHYRAGKYDRERGRLSSWLVTIAQNCIHDLRESRAQRKEYRGESAMLPLSGAGELDDLFEQECRKQIVEQAMNELRATTRMDEKTIRAFELVAIHQKSVAEASAETGLPADSIYAAKHRCLSQLREILKRLQRAYELE